MRRKQRKNRLANFIEDEAELGSDDEEKADLVQKVIDKDDIEDRLDDLNDEVSKELSDIVTKAMSVDKDKRFSSMDQLKAALEKTAAQLD